MINDERGIRRENVRIAVYRALAATGTAPDMDSLASILGYGRDEVLGFLRDLANDRHIVLDDDAGIVMAHPFSTIPMGFSVTGRETLWWGGCAWDSFALPHLLPDESEVLVATTCPGCGRPHAWVVDDSSPPQGDQIAHFLVPVAEIWDDVIHSCRNQRIFCDIACVDDWLHRTDTEEGYIMDLATLWRLASRWYEGRLDHGYERRDPSTAKEYFRGVGLTGPFWGL